MERTLPAILANTTPVGECLVWNGSCRRDGYPQARFSTSHLARQPKTKASDPDRHRITMEAVHRVVMELILGRIPVNFVLHTCDNPPCVRPEHLWEGTHADNMKDMKRKGHVRKPRRLANG
jgi:hypothetical protein